jgi:menaquinone-dependent protoporphyrinogen oxidase
MNQRILVTYSSKAGSTAGVATKIGEVLSKHNLAVDVLPVSKVSDLTPYSAVIAGSAIRMGRVLPEAITFIEKNQQVLQQKPFSVFIVCLTIKDDTEANRATVSAYLDPVRALVKPASEGLFAGVMDGSKVGLLERLMMKAMKAPEGDFRNWEQISSWAENIKL